MKIFDIELKKPSFQTAAIHAVLLIVQWCTFAILVNAMPGQIDPVTINLALVALGWGTIANMLGVNYTCGWRFVVLVVTPILLICSLNIVFL